MRLNGRATAWKGIVIIVTVLLAGSGLSPAHADLREYVQRPDATFAFNLQSTTPSGPVTLYNIRLTSQTWQGITWQHWLTVIKPKDVTHPDKSLLFITGGSNTDPEPKLDSERMDTFADIAVKSGSIVSILRQVPNEPLFDGMVEDEIISYTFDKYLKGEGDDWPLLFPMVKSAVRAMDTVQQFAKNEFKQDIGGFVVTGASKRGWTSWLTGAADPRVVAIAPMVIDVLNMPAQMKQQIKSYGKYSEEIEDYSERDIQARQDTPEGKRLNEQVDPYAFRESLTMPKLLLLGTNDPYWTVDAANLYINDLKGDTWIHYEPNTGHDVEAGGVAALLAFYRAVLQGKTLPKCSAGLSPEGEISMTYEGKPQINVWMARSITRDFRPAKWEKRSLQDIAGVISDAGFSELGYTAFFVEFVYTDEAGETYSLSSPMTVLPKDQFPYDEKGTKIARSEPHGEHDPPATPQ
ncbi:MAG: PhoPQ-activated protein PqaA family protein [FCB group bacterium]|jgi:PhoPQ-activated pathogenicity-related protein|nr:PhoPQ-activated protein PqaA family protein [FCB group bacterium]